MVSTQTSEKLKKKNFFLCEVRSKNPSAEHDGGEERVMYLSEVESFNITLCKFFVPYWSKFSPFRGALTSLHFPLRVPGCSGKPDPTPGTDVLHLHWKVL